MAAERILIAEDNEMIASTLQEQLSALGYEVAGVARGRADVLRLGERERPDLLLLDMQMPELNGLDAVRELAERVGAPVVMMIAFGDAADVQNAEAAGALAYLVKPVNPEEIPPAIDIALARYRDFERLRHRVNDLQETIEARKVIERAKGILMRRFRIGDAQAEERMNQQAAKKQVTLREIAQAIVDSDALLG